MSGAPLIAPAARRSRARRVAVVLVLAGLLALAGLQCADAMGVDMHPGHGAVMMLDTEAASGHWDGPGDAGGVLALCLAVLFVVAAVAGLRGSGPRIVAVRRRCWPRGVLRAVAVRGPSLAELCVLRA